MSRFQFRIIPAIAVCILGFVFLSTAGFAQNTPNAGDTQPSASARDDKSPSATPPALAAPITDKTDVAAKSPGKPSNAEILAELERMRARIQELESLLNAQGGEGSASTPLAGAAQPNNVAVTTSTSQPMTSGAVPIAGAPAVLQEKTAKPTKSEPFAFADFTWLNGNSRTMESPLDTKYFTPEIRVDASYIMDFHHPSDHTLVGSSESGRTGEVLLQQLGIGGDFHVGNVRARFMTQYGMYSTMTPRNDASPGVGQWNLADAYRYISEAYGGYHFNVMHGINVDAGIFMSYVGLFSYYNFDSWAYQPSYVSSNTPWFFQGVRVQIFPSDKLKIEPWFVNGWQSYGKFNHYPGAGGQIAWRPTGWLSLVFNNYGLGTDTVFAPGRSRIHTDDSIQVKYYDKPQNTLDKAAFTFTFDAGCEYGGGVSCFGNRPGGPKQSFIGFMFYNRFWFHKDMFGLTIGGGGMNNPGRYLVLVPPINGATAFSGTPYFTANPGDQFKAWDVSGTFDYMPKQFITFRFEFDHREANVPYFAGPGGVTPPGGNTGPAGSFVPGFTPDLRKNETRLNIALLVKF